MEPPRPAQVLVLVKVVERCNLNCSYCYMYTGADQSWRRRPAALSEHHQDLLVERVREFLAVDPAACVCVEFHGGEPLLLGKPAMRRLLESLQHDRVTLCLQTNGVLLDDEWIDLFVAHRVSFSLSCDGPPAAADRFRLYHNGRSTAADVERAIALAVRRTDARHLFGGCLAVANPAFDGGEIVRYFHGLGVHAFDLLLPDANHVTPPKHLPDYTHAAMLRYYKQAFDAWIAVGDPRFEVRIFREMILGIFGRPSELDGFGGDLTPLVVVESDGSYQLLDVLRIVGEDAVRTDMRLADHPLAEFQAWNRQRQIGPCGQCLACPAFESCGGGYLPHRFNGVDFASPTYYCEVMLGLHEYVHAYVHRVTPAEIWRPRRPDAQAALA